uniref:26.2 kDa heat shock protein, mitochondrial n=1 Tax=Aegilops tauschii TaxID=37682 RepID=M8CGS2_AEGTA
MMQEFQSNPILRRATLSVGAPAESLGRRAGQFGAHTSLGRLLSALEDAAAPTGLSSTAGASRLGRWVAKVDDDAVYLKVPMPGLGKEHVKGDKEPWDGDDDSAVPRYSRRIKVPADAFKMDKIKAEMKNGVLRVTLPRLKEEERKDVFQVKIE